MAITAYEIFSVTWMLIEKTLSVARADAAAFVQRELRVLDQIEVLRDDGADALIAAAFLGRRAEQDDVAIERVAPRGEQPHRDRGRGQRSLVVDGAAPVQVAVALGRLEWRRGPLRQCRRRRRPCGP